MQYLLDEREMAAVRADREGEAKLPGRSIGACLQLLGDECKRIATTVIPDIEGRSTPYGCIHVDRRSSYGYCDRCPVQKICPLPKDFSK